MSSVSKYEPSNSLKTLYKVNNINEKTALNYEEEINYRLNECLNKIKNQHIINIDNALNPITKMLIDYLRVRIENIHAHNLVEIEYFITFILNNILGFNSELDNHISELIPDLSTKYEEDRNTQNFKRCLSIWDTVFNQILDDYIQKFKDKIINPQEAKIRINLECKKEFNTIFANMGTVKKECDSIFSELDTNLFQLQAILDRNQPETSNKEHEITEWKKKIIQEINLFLNVLWFRVLVHMKYNLKVEDGQCFGFTLAKKIKSIYEPSNLASFLQHLYELIRISENYYSSETKSIGKFFVNNKEKFPEVMNKINSIYSIKSTAFLDFYNNESTYWLCGKFIWINLNPAEKWNIIDAYLKFDLQHEKDKLQKQFLNGKFIEKKEKKTKILKTDFGISTPLLERYGITNLKRLCDKKPIDELPLFIKNEIISQNVIDNSSEEIYFQIMLQSPSNGHAGHALLLVIGNQFSIIDPNEYNPLTLVPKELISNTKNIDSFIDLIVALISTKYTELMFSKFSICQFNIVENQKQKERSLRELLYYRKRISNKMFNLLNGIEIKYIQLQKKKKKIKLKKMNKN